MTLPYAGRLASHLYQSRNAGLSFERAWSAAIKAHPAPGPQGTIDAWAPETITFAKRAFRDAYIGAGQSNGPLGILQHEYAAWTDRPVPEPVVSPPSRRCGSGEVCHRDARKGGWLCADHSEAIHAALERAQYKSRVEVRMGPMVAA